MSWLHKEVPSRVFALLAIAISSASVAPELWIALMRPDDLRLPSEHSKRQYDEKHAQLASNIKIGESLLAAHGDEVRISEIRAEQERIERQLETLESNHQAEDASMREQVRKGIVRRGAMLGGLIVLALVSSFWPSKPVDITSLPEISEEVASICNNPNRNRIEAVKAYCNETGLSIREGKAVIEARVAKQSKAI